MEPGAEPRCLRRGRRPWGSSTEHGYEGGHRNWKPEAFPGVTGPRIRQGKPDRRRSDFFLFFLARPQFVRRFLLLLRLGYVSERQPLLRFHNNVAGWNKGAVN